MEGTEDQDRVNWISRLQTLPEFECGKPASASDIADSESRLGLGFPEVYKEFLRRYGYASWFGSEILGISEDPYFNVVSGTIAARDEPVQPKFLPFPTGSIVLNRDGEGGYYVLDCYPSEKNCVRLITVESQFRTEHQWKGIREFVIDSYFD